MRRPFARRVFLVACAGCVIGILAAGFRYYRHRACVSMVEKAEAALPSLRNVELARDLGAHVRYLRGRLAKGWLYSKRDVFLGRLHREVRQVLEAGQGKVNAPHLKPGHHVIVTVSRVDGAEMPTSVMVPEGANPKDPLDVVLILHGGGAREMLHCFPGPSYPGVLCVTPLARGSHDYLGVQMTAVEECLEDVLRRYEYGRIYVMGRSMGGMGAWLYAERWIGAVSGVSPWKGNAEPAAWKGYWEPAPAEDLSPAGRAAKLVREARSPIARVEQLYGGANPPVYVGHGTEDTIIPVGHGDAMVQRLRELGATVRYDRLEGLGHGNIPAGTEERIRWLLEQSKGREPAPKTAVIPPLTFAADCAGAPPHRAVDPLKPARLTFDYGGNIVAAQNAEPWDVKGPNKWSYAGPAGIAFEHPFSIVLPEGAPEYLKVCVEEFSGAWRERYGGTPRLSTPEEGFSVFPPREGRREVRTLVALGPPQASPVVRGALEHLDVVVEEGKVRIFGREYRGEDIGLIIVRPNPDEPGDATLTIWGSTADSYRQIWRRFGQAVDWEGDRGRWWFEYAIFDRRTCGPNTFLAVGFFDHEWRFSERLLFEGSAELRSKMPGSHWVVPARPADEAGRVPLASLSPGEIDSARGPVGFDRSAGVDKGALSIGGREFERGIGMVAPARVKWLLGRRVAKFRATVGLERTGSKYPIRYEAEQVRFEVWGDDRPLAASAVMSSTGGVFEIEADVSGIETLELRAVNTTRHVWHYGPVGWGDAALTPASP